MSNDSDILLSHQFVDNSDNPTHSTAPQQNPFLQLSSFLLKNSVFTSSSTQSSANQSLIEQKNPSEEQSTTLDLNLTTNEILPIISCSVCNSSMSQPEAVLSSSTITSSSNLSDSSLIVMQSQNFIGTAQQLNLTAIDWDANTRNNPTVSNPSEASDSLANVTSSRSQTTFSKCISVSTQTFDDSLLSIPSETASQKVHIPQAATTSSHHNIQHSHRNLSGVSINLINGDLTNETAGAIVNPTNASFDRVGRLSHAIISKGGPDLLRECRQQGTLTEAGAITGAGHLQCDRVIHVLTASNEEECKTAVQAALKLADQHSIKSISLPPIGFGYGGMPCDQVANCITYEVVSKAVAKSLGSISMVRLVAFNEVELNEFEEQLQQLINDCRKQEFNRACGSSRDSLDGKLLTMGHHPRAAMAMGRLPNFWARMSNNIIYKQVEVLPTDIDYKDAMDHFQLQGRKLHHIFRIQNRKLYLHFIVEKTVMEKKYPNESTNERLLYHGTYPDTVPKINSRGFDPIYNGDKTGTIYGQGSYFACDIKLADKWDIFSSRNPSSGHKYIYVAQVLVGHSCLGNSSMKHLPEQPDGSPYDSAANNNDSTKATMFVIFNIAQTNPKYLYEFS